MLCLPTAATLTALLRGVGVGGGRGAILALRTLTVLLRSIAMDGRDGEVGL